MKAFSGGQLLDGPTSPFGHPLTETQCIQCALDKPGVLTVLPGVRGVDDLRRVLGYLETSQEERDCSILGAFAPKDAAGVCVNCNHCQPCPAGLDMGLINKYYDLARAGNALAADHYRTLAVRADACAGCGHCNRRCPFHVDGGWRRSEAISMCDQNKQGTLSLERPLLAFTDVCILLRSDGTQSCDKWHTVVPMAMAGTLAVESGAFHKTV